ncbi:hypothetical protein [Acidovorax sp. SUPP3334]|uniref:hypothetical protein n=1 Tax=Acidovorax sp. SUPP3334 TaxID=2920881 RepID=UPI0023DE26DD|nr:hypothetical protein [Acidovorax sp. SUPP3334]GKT26370.1 hypothetical protein AVHM3334_20805 [Acidovorax sp. SUPP3334]
MSKILLLIALTIPPGLAAKLDAPRWALLLSAVPFGLLAMHMGDSDEHLFGDASEKVGRFLFLAMGIGGVALGLLAWSLRGTASALGMLWWFLPVALVLLLVGIVRILFK